MFTTDTFPRVKKRNHGDVPQYFVSGSNPPIISKETFENAQLLIQRRYQKVTTAKTQGMPLAQKVFCGHCGTAFRKKLCNGRIFWTCRTHDTEKENCPVKQVPQETIYGAFLRLYYNLKHHPEILTQMETSLRTIRSHRMLWSLDIVELNKRIADLTSQNQMLAQLKKQGLIDPDIFISQQNSLSERLRATKQEKEKLLDADEDTTLQDTRDIKVSPETEGQILTLLNGLIEAPETIQQSTVDTTSKNTEKLESELETILETQPIDEESAKQPILQIAAARYESIPSEEYETQRLRRIFAKAEKMEELNAELLKGTVSEIRVTSRAVTVRLKNNQTIERRFAP